MPLRLSPLGRSISLLPYHQASPNPSENPHPVSPPPSPSPPMPDAQLYHKPSPVEPPSPSSSRSGQLLSLLASSQPVAESDRGGLPIRYSSLTYLPPRVTYSTSVNPITCHHPSLLAASLTSDHLHRPTESTPPLNSSQSPFLDPGRDHFPHLIDDHDHAHTSIVLAVPRLQPSSLPCHRATPMPLCRSELLCMDSRVVFKYNFLPWPFKFSKPPAMEVFPTYPNAVVIPIIEAVRIFFFKSGHPHHHCHDHRRAVGAAALLLLFSTRRPPPFQSKHRPSIETRSIMADHSKLQSTTMSIIPTSPATGACSKATRALSKLPITATSS